MARRRRAAEQERERFLPGQLIIRFKPGAVEEVARNSLGRSVRESSVAAAIPDEVRGPLELLRQEAGAVSMKPLFAQQPVTARSGDEAISLRGMHRSLAQSATSPPKRALEGFQLIKLEKEEVTPRLLKKLQASKAVELVERVPNRWLTAADPRIGLQWGLRAIGWFEGRRPNAANVHVAVLDSGVDRPHPDLQDAIEAYRHDGNAARDFTGHGSHVAGIIAAVMNNGVGVAGVANCRLHCWKVFDDPIKAKKKVRFNFDFYSAALAAALDSRIKVVNLSIGGVEYSSPEAAVINELRGAGVIVAAAMGNEYEEGNPVEYPAAYDGALAVGAVDDAGQRASFSCTGGHIGLVAPGTDILSTVPRTMASLATKTRYDSWDGTSMASPFVAGAAALLYAKRPKSKASANAIVKRLISTAKKLPRMRGKKFTSGYGAGLLDLAKAL